MFIAVLKRVRRAILSQVDQASFDWRYRTDTTDIVSNQHLAATSPTLPFGTEFQPTLVREFRQIVRELNISLENFAFVDFGCGQGRILLLAALAGFRRGTGIDYSATVLEAGRHNIVIFHTRARRKRALKPRSAMRWIDEWAIHGSPPKGIKEIHGWPVMR